MNKQLNKQLAMFTICASPSDYPGKFTVRKHLVPSGATDEVTVYDTLDEARAPLAAQGLICWVRALNDDPVIVETWF